MKIVNRKIAELNAAVYNPRKLSDEERANIRASLDKFGFVDPIIVNKHPERVDIIVGGHQRVKIWGGDMGNDKIPTVEVSLTEDDERELNVRLNRNAGAWDFEKLAAEFSFDELDEWGFDESELEEIFPVPDFGADDVEEDDFDCEPPEDPKTELGRIYQLGNHRLMCGDSTDEKTVARLMDGEKADMVFTDPPYGMFLDADYSGMKNNLDFAKNKGFTGGKKYKNVIGDHEDFDPSLIDTVFNNFGYCKEIFLWGADYYADNLQDRNCGSWIVWDKRLDQSADKMYGSCFELCWSKSRHKRDIVRIKWAGVFGTEKEFDHKRHHPTQKPALLPIWFFDRWGNEGDIVADIYGGSGSTLIACEQTGRKCRMMELDPKYCDVIVERYCALKGIDAEAVFETGVAE